MCSSPTKRENAMKIVTVTDREFDRATNEAFRAAKQAPVFITSAGEPTHVLMSIEDYERLTGQKAPRGAELPA